ncbi:hypothetical protein BDN72DRAFT_585116 [Pluteus cervinus]|uniref:Uncharacterized protein n=1 Tax=Pluteus cervinus TaxID=181527 RepID=A0ACD3AWQ2_9AGAR|nr:hypothetical protein BDN72DRAFT_585116 [Pluteus cervinus]
MPAVRSSAKRSATDFSDSISGLSSSPSHISSYRTRTSSPLDFPEQEDDHIPTPHIAFSSASLPTSLRRKSSNYITIPPIKHATGRSRAKAPNPAKEPVPATLTINGVLLKPSPVFNTFWKFAAERKAIDDRRRAGQEAPWTNDPILQKYFFCNTYRVLDKVTQYLIKEVIQKGPQDVTEVVYRIVLFNMFTKIETWELLTEALGTLTWKNYERRKYEDVLREAKRQGTTLYTGAFIKPAPKFGHTENYANHLCLLETWMENDLPWRLSQAAYLVEVYEWLIAFPGMGEFTTYQLVLNLSYCKYLNFSGFDFVVPGPGSTSGLKKMFGSSMDKAVAKNPHFEVEVMRWLAEHQNEQFDRLGLEFSGLGPKRLPMDLADIEHTLCEVDKYSRVAHPQFKGKRTEIRRSFASSTPLPPLSLPSSWKSPARKTVRVRAEPPVVDKRYTINYIKTSRRRPDNTREFHVFWVGYGDSDATWEPEEGLRMDAPNVLDEYLKAHPKA